ncbi:S-crystallin SL11-like [Aplysia californica]|uniref:S-crystallin SL11-like n=1 Tax=Aplysia californica TaxID=6500 RepID=A0ABM1VZK5_APLCA|nr:S-crystallin SL11-like [Aplysia californica]
MSSPNVKIYYFDMMGRAEMIRMLFAVAGKQIENIRFSFEDWPKSFKEKAPFGTTPWVEIDGEVHAQSMAIAIYFAREFGFYGKTNRDGLLIDQVLNLIHDFIEVSIVVYKEPDKEKRAQCLKDCQDKSTRLYFGGFEQILKKTGTGYVAGNQISLADIAIFDVVTGWMKPFLGPIDEFPLCKALLEKVAANEKIKGYMATRPYSSKKEWGDQLLV